jgi:hypothetical protein
MPLNKMTSQVPAATILVLLLASSGGADPLPLITKNIQSIPLALQGGSEGKTLAASVKKIEIECRNENTKDDKATPFFNKIFDINKKIRVSDKVLDTHVPQGLTTWYDYFDVGQDLLVYTAYNENGGRAVLQGVNPRTGEHTRQVKIGKGHVGGIAIWRDWAFVSEGDKSVRRYKLSELRNRFNGTEKGELVGARAGSVEASSFIDIANGKLYAGRFSEDSRDSMYVYDLIPTSGDIAAPTIQNPVVRIEVPQKTQGLKILPNYYIFSTSFDRNNRSNIYIMNRDYKSLDAAYAAKELKCFRAPTMSEGVATSNRRLYVLFESGAYKYTSDPDNLPDRVLKEIPAAPLDSLPLIRRQ